MYQWTAKTDGRRGQLAAGHDDLAPALSKLRPFFALDAREGGMGGEFDDDDFCHSGSVSLRRTPNNSDSPREVSTEMG